MPPTINTPDGPAPELSPEDLAYLDRAFVFHPLAGDQLQRSMAIRLDARRLATTILTGCPPGPERQLALRNLEQAMFWANAGSAREGAQ
jgi:hypothetical protein